MDIAFRLIYGSCILLAAIGILFLFHYMKDKQTQRKIEYAEKLVQQQKAQYDLLFEQNSTIIKRNHDYKNFIIGILSELERKNYDAVKQKLLGELQAIQSVSEKTLTGSSIIDTILNHKIALAETKGAKLALSYKNVRDIHISGIDLSILLGNALDNAIEAAEKVEEKDRKTVRLFIALQGEKVIITVTNFVSHSIETDYLKTAKGDPALHGFGIINMKAIVSKYNGEISFSCVDNVFKTSIFMNNCAK